MIISPQCINCIFNQTYRITQELHLNDTQAKAVLDRASSFIPKFSMSHKASQA